MNYEAVFKVQNLNVWAFLFSYIVLQNAQTEIFGSELENMA